LPYVSVNFDGIPFDLFKNFGYNLDGLEGRMEFLPEQIHFMKLAYRQAKRAYEKGETPVGAIVVKDGIVIARAYNKREMLQDPTAHAEVIAIKKASKKINSWRLSGCDVYVTLEPCPMCAGVMIQARIKNVFFGAKDPKAGVVGSVMDLLSMEKFNHRVHAYGGLMEKECAALLTDFFENLRAKKKKTKI
jgi:tRNA(adenine34) deaminase